ncbi:MAG: EAL domain-containing protein [Pseudomonadota bacterium]
MTAGETLRLLIVEESGSDAESLANELRNAGHALACTHVTDAAALDHALEQQLPDILVCGSGAGLPDPRQLGTLLARYDTPPAVIAIAASADEDSVVSARKDGISELVSYDHPEHLRLAFARLAEHARIRQATIRLEKKLRDCESRCQALIENSSDAIAYIHDGMHVYANPPYLKLFAIETAEEIEGLPVLDMISSAEHDRFRDLLKHVIEGDDQTTSLDIECVSPHEGRFSCTMECSPASMAGEPCTQILVRVHSTNTELEERIKTLSQQDMLTGLVNRQHFMKMLEQRLAHFPKNRQRALVYLTLDNFKVIRDEAGVATSDQVLCDMADLIARHCGQEDTLARFGDYSFAILKQDTDQDAIEGSCTGLLKDIAAHLPEAGGRSFAITASLGICAIGPHTKDIQKLISYADMACEVARTSGGNQLHIHSSVVSSGLDHDAQDKWDEIVSDTIANERFYLVYQPIVSLKGDTKPRYEVLLRILDEKGQTILPGQFLSIAEKAGHGSEIDRWIINRACSDLAQLRKRSSAATFYIKLTAATLAAGDMPAWIRDRLREHELDVSSMVFEIAEQAATADLRGAMTCTEALQGMGCKVALEHVGRTGKLQVLNHMPVDIIKIDSSLIAKLAGDKQAQDTVRAIMEHAKKNGRSCIAENVEDSGCLARLWQIGMHFIQGNFIQEPSRELGYVFESELA